MGVPQNYMSLRNSAFPLYPEFINLKMMRIDRFPKLAKVPFFFFFNKNVANKIPTLKFRFSWIRLRPGYYILKLFRCSHLGTNIWKPLD